MTELDSIKAANVAQPYFDLGSHSLPITTNSLEAQIWFDRGLNWCYGFNHEEAEHCFHMAIAHDPKCAMAYWGVAYAAGPNYNLPWEHFTDSELAAMVTHCYANVQLALKHVEDTSPLESDLIHALANRFPIDHLDDIETSVEWSQSYANAMRLVRKRFPLHPDICALTADALMNRTPWRLWDVQTGTPAPDADTLEVKAMLERAMDNLASTGEVSHSGLLHFYIHLMEMSPTPEDALPASRALGGLIPASGHLHHMPSHIYMLCGLYEESLSTNEIAHQVNQTYADASGANNFYTIYRCHDIHFVMYSAMFLGQSRRAISAADEMAAMITPDLANGGKELFRNYMDGFSAMRIHAYIRFGEWQKVLSLPLPNDPIFYCVTTTMLHYGRGVAYAALGLIKEAEQEVTLFERAYKEVPDQRMIFNNEAREILSVGREMLYGEVEYRKDNYEMAYKHLRQSVVLHDNLNYTEPWVWMQPTRHALAALLLEQNYVEEAAEVYRADLGLDKSIGRPYWHLDNVWSLHGYYECLQRLGCEVEAAKIKPKLDKALEKADVEINSSCFCRSAESCCRS